MGGPYQVHSGSSSATIKTKRQLNDPDCIASLPPEIEQNLVHNEDGATEAYNFRISTDMVIIRLVVIIQDDLLNSLEASFACRS